MNAGGDWILRRCIGMDVEPLARVAQCLLEKLLNVWHGSWRDLKRITAYHQTRNAASYASRASQPPHPT